MPRTLFLFISLFCKFSFAQNGFEIAFDIDSLPHVHNHGVEIIQTSDENYVCASFHKNNGLSPVTTALTKISDEGNIIWKKHLPVPCSGPDVAILGLVELKDGSYLLYGEGDLICFYPYDFSVAFFIKTDTAGSILWTKTFGGNGYIAYINDLIATTDSGFITCGDIPPYGSCLSKFDSEGDSVWTKFYFPVDSTIASGSIHYQNSLIQIIENNDQTFAVFGIYNFQSTILNTNSVGDSLSAFVFPDSSCQCSNAIKHFVRVGEKSFIGVVAKIDTNTLQTIKSFYFLTDSLGYLSWKRTDITYPLITSLAYLPNSDIIIAGDSICMNNYGVPYIGFVKINSQGSEVWNYCLDVQYMILPWGLIGGIKLNHTSDNSILMTGSIDSTNQGSYESIYCLKLDSGGNILTSNIVLDVEEEIVSISPNPVTSYFRVNSIQPIGLLRIFNVLGVLQLEIEQPINDILIPAITPGMYFLQIQTKSGLTIRKFIKQ